MKKSLVIGIVILLVMAVLSGIVLAKRSETGALAITTDPSNVLVSVSNGGLIVEKYSPFWTGDLTPGNYIVTVTFTNPEKVVSKTVEVIAGRTVPVHLSAKTHTVVNVNPCGDQIQDADGNMYNTVLIGSQCWMKENFRGTHYADGSLISGRGNPITTPPTAYPGAPTVEGLLYNWNDATHKPLIAGWHIPTDTEFKTLEMYLGMTQAQADATGWRGTDQGTQLKKGGSSGFDGLMAGLWNIEENNPIYGDASGLFGVRGTYAFFWSSTRHATSLAHRRILYNIYPWVYRSLCPMYYGFSVRCLQN